MTTEESNAPDTGTLIPPVDRMAEANQLLARHESPGEVSDLRRELTKQAARDAHDELEHLKKSLAAHDAAKLIAQTIAAQLQKRIKSLESDNNRLRAETKRAQDQLALGRQEINTELTRAADREAALKKELVELRRQVTLAADKVSGRKTTYVLTFGVAILAILAAAGVYLYSTSMTRVAHDQPPVSSVIAQSAPIQSVSEKRLLADNSKASTHDLETGLELLDRALGNFKGQNPEDVLKRVHLQNAAMGISVCSFAWNNGDPTLEFDAKESMNLGASMAKCADAVEKASQ